MKFLYKPRSCPIAKPFWSFLDLLGKAPSDPAEAVEAKVEDFVASTGPAKEEAVAKELPDPSGGIEQEVDPVTPPPKLLDIPKDFSEPKFKHWTYKSKRVGFFCRDCKMSSHDPSAFRTRPCLPEEWKTSPQHAEDEVNSPAEGEEKLVQEQLLEAQQLQEKLQLLKDLREEEARLEELFRLKASGAETEIVETSVGKSGVEKIQEGDHGMGSNGVDLSKSHDIPMDHLETLPFDSHLAAAEASLGLTRVTPEQKVMEQAEVQKDYERDMETFESNNMSRHDKGFFDPFAKNFKCGKVVAVVGNIPEPVEEHEDTNVEENQTETTEETKVEDMREKKDSVPESAKQSFAELASMCAELQQSAGPCDEKMSALVGKLKRSLEDFVKTTPGSSLNGEKGDVGEGGTDAIEETNPRKRQKVERQEKEELERPAAVARAQFVSPKMQTQMTKSKCNDEVGEEDAEDEAEEEDEEEEEVKPRRRRNQPKAKAKAKSKAKAKAKSKAKAKAKSKASKATGSKDNACKRNAAGTTQESAKRSKKEPADKSGGAMAGGKEICEFCEAQKKKLRSLQSSSYHVAKKKALAEGLDAQEAAELGKKVS